MKQRITQKCTCTPTLSLYTRHVHMLDNEGKEIYTIAEHGQEFCKCPHCKLSGEK